MLTERWMKTEGVTDSQNSFDSVCAKVVDNGISIAYVFSDNAYIVDVRGVFDVCPMAATGYTQEQVQEFLPPGSVAVPVLLGGKAHVLTIDCDYNLTIVDDEDVIAKGLVDTDNIEECLDSGDLDDDLGSLLGFM